MRGESRSGVVGVKRGALCVNSRVLLLLLPALPPRILVSLAFSRRPELLLPVLSDAKVDMPDFWLTRV